jgi:glycosyltransferase involved in cell wall biosynthesis
MKHKRILFISQTALGSSPTNRYVQLCSYLSEQGYAPTLFFVAKGKDKGDGAVHYPRTIGAVRIFSTPAIPEVLLGKPNPLKSALTGLFLVATCLPLLVVHCLRAQLVHLGKPLPFGAFTTLLATTLTRRKLIIDLDDWEGVGGFATVKQGGNAFAKAVITFFEEWLPVRADGVVVVSALLAQRVALSNVPPERIHYIPNGADIQKFSPTLSGKPIREQYGLSDVPVLAYLGTFKPGGANWQFIMDVFACVAREHSQAMLMIIGFGPQLEQAREYARSLDIVHRICFTGRVEHNDVPRYLAAADLYILPYSDEFPDTFINLGRSSLKLYEYMAMGKPVVASNLGELRESLQDERGILVDGTKPAPFGAAIIKLLQDPHHMARLGNRARQATEEIYNYRSLALKLAKVYESIA